MKIKVVYDSGIYGQREIHCGIFEGDSLMDCIANMCDELQLFISREDFEEWEINSFEDFCNYLGESDGGDWIYYIKDMDSGKLLYETFEDGFEC